MTTNGKPKVAFFDFASCEGCQLTVVDTLQLYPDLLDAVQIVQFREAMSEKTDDYQVAFIEGSCTRPQDEERLKSIREKAQVVIALGACAHLGGVNTLRNWQSQDHVIHYVYGEMGKRYNVYAPRPIEAVIPIDAFIPGCPIDRQEFVRIVKAYVHRRPIRLPDYPVCVECRLKENLCLVKHGVACLGSITRAGCNAICPSNGAGCDGCRGLVSDANIGWLKVAFHEQGIPETAFSEKMKLFQSYQFNGITASDVV
jgi:sulfhydrogenase subunit delta